MKIYGLHIDSEDLFYTYWGSGNSAIPSLSTEVKIKSNNTYGFTLCVF